MFPTVQTTPSVIHATDLVRIGDRVAFISAMRMARVGNGDPRATARAPVLVSLRYLDDAFLLEASKQNYLAEARLAVSPALRDGETSTPVMNSDGVPLATMAWKPALGGSMVIDSLLMPAAGVFGVIAVLVLLMALRMRRLMKRDDEHLVELEQAHLELKAKEAQAHHLVGETGGHTFRRHPFHTPSGALAALSVRIRSMRRRVGCVAVCRRSTSMPSSPRTTMSAVSPTP